MQYCIFLPTSGSRGSATDFRHALRFMLHPHPNPLPLAGEGDKQSTFLSPLLLAGEGDKQPTFITPSPASGRGSG